MRPVRLYLDLCHVVYDDISTQSKLAFQTFAHLRQTMANFIVPANPVREFFPVAHPKPADNYDVLVPDASQLSADLTGHQQFNVYARGQRALSWQSPPSASVYAVPVARKISLGSGHYKNVQMVEENNKSSLNSYVNMKEDGLPLADVDFVKRENDAYLHSDRWLVRGARQPDFNDTESDINSDETVYQNAVIKNRSEPLVPAAALWNSTLEAAEMVTDSDVQQRAPLVAVEHQYQMASPEDIQASRKQVQVLFVLNYEEC